MSSNHQRKSRTSQRNPTESAWHWTRKKSDVDISNPEHLAELHLQGMSYSEMEQCLGVPHSTAHSRARRVLRQKHNSFNLAQCITTDYIKNPKVSNRDKQVIREWLSKNARQLGEIEGTFYSYIQEKNIAVRETSPQGDWSDDLIISSEGSVIPKSAARKPTQSTKEYYA